jgi:hypothetical protein
MKLLGTNTSPYVRKVRLVLLEKTFPTFISSTRLVSLAVRWPASIRWEALADGIMDSAVVVRTDRRTTCRHM